MHNTSIYKSEQTRFALNFNFKGILETNLDGTIVKMPVAVCNAYPQTDIGNEKRHFSSCFV